MKKAKNISALERFLLLVLAGMALCTTTVTLWAFTHTTHPPRTPEEAAGAGAAGEAMFTGVGRVRVPLGDSEKQASLVLTPVFPYETENPAFYGELASHVENFRGECRALFGTLTADEVREAGEESLKAALLARYNALLVLGKLREIYFAEFIILD